MQLHPLKLVTIVTEQILKDQIVKKIIELGAAGCTWQEAQGTGSRGARRDAVGGGNVQIEVICPDSVAEAILTFVSRNYFDQYACLAWVTDVSVVRGKRYEKTSG
ncbi:MAG TPA: hypothetical protein VKU82_15930 [Planctomycetaceae bacterium]|nr:hypothetical protein [Planctomycetaceae bacterium]